MTVVILISWLTVAIVAVPMLMVTLECLLAIVPMKKRPVDLSLPRPKVAVLVPAYNEELVIERTVRGLIGKLNDNDQLIVVADNCTDATARIAGEAGAIVVERHHLEKQGKGYALEAGIYYLRENPPDIVVVIDADCRITSGDIEILARNVQASGRPVQCLNLIDSISSDKDRMQVREVLSSFAFIIKNQVRPRGLDRMSQPVPLHGTGMAIPWRFLSQQQLSTGDIVEDLSYSLDLIEQGFGAIAYHDFSITSSPPNSDNAALKQRSRWEHGYLDTLLRRGPKMLLKGIMQARPMLVFSALDLMVPPLTLLMIVTSIVLVFALTASMLTGIWQPLLYLLACLFTFTVMLLISWWRFARDRIPARILAGIPLYIIWKFPIYMNYILKRENTWVRTERNAKDRVV